MMDKAENIEMIKTDTAEKERSVVQMRSAGRIPFYYIAFPCFVNIVFNNSYFIFIIYSYTINSVSKNLIFP